jgi:hypothetical protein
LAYGFRNFSPRSAGYIALVAEACGRGCLPQAARKQREGESQRDREGPGTMYTLQRHNHSDLLPAARPHLLTARNSSMG